MFKDHNNEYNLTTLSMPFIQAALNSFVSQVPPVKLSEKYSATATLASIKKESLKYMVMFLYDTPRSKLIKAMTKNPRYGSLTPLFLYAYREEYGIKYEDWDKSDPKLKYFLGKYLENLVEFTTERMIEEFESEKYPTSQIVDKLRGFALMQKSNSTIKKVTDYKMNIYLHSGDLIMPKCSNFMLLQTWIANASIRVTDAMILDPWDWNNTPNAFDVDMGFSVSVDKVSKKQETTIKEDDEYPF